MRTVAWWGGLLKETVAEWWQDKAPRLGAALAFYTALSLAPLLILVAPAAGAVFGPEFDARQQIAAQFSQLFGADAGGAIHAVLEASQGPQRPGALATALSIGVLLFAASGVFAELQDALDTIWEVAPKPTNKAALISLLRQRFLSFAMVLCIGFLLLVSLLFSAALSALRDYAAPRVTDVAVAWTVANNVVSFVVITLLFAMMFKVLPDVKIRWRDVWLGAALTSGMFTLGRFLIGEYIGRTTLWSSYGAGKSLVVLLVWIYYSAQILFLGAEFTRAYVRRLGAPVELTEGAVPVTEEERAQQGIPHQEVVEAVAEVVQRKAAAAAEEGGDDEAPAPAPPAGGRE